MSAHTGRLLLTTQDPFSLPEPAPLTVRLSEAGFLGPPLEGCRAGFAVGERFLQLVIFAGCSVQIQLSPMGDSPFCHIRFTGPFRRPVFLSGRNTRPPRCRNCRGRLRNWQAALFDRGNAGPEQIICPACGETNPPWSYDWTEQAGFGRLFIRIEEVFPGEAIPTSALMGLLEAASGCKWRHFYIQEV